MAKHCVSHGACSNGRAGPKEEPCLPVMRLITEASYLHLPDAQDPAPRSKQIMGEIYGEEFKRVFLEDPSRRGRVLWGMQNVLWRQDVWDFLWHDLGIVGGAFVFADPTNPNISDRDVILLQSIATSSQAGRVPKGRFYEIPELWRPKWCRHARVNPCGLLVSFLFNTLRATQKFYKDETDFVQRWLEAVWESMGDQRKNGHALIPHLYCDEAEVAAALLLWRALLIACVSGADVGREGVNLAQVWDWVDGVCDKDSLSPVELDLVDMFSQESKHAPPYFEELKNQAQKACEKLDQVRRFYARWSG